MPPESLQEQKYSYKSDAWSMGVVLWEIFSRQDPFPGVSPVQVAIGVSSRGMCLRPPSACPPAIAQLMYDCWAYDPRERPDFRTIARTIEQVIDSNPDNYCIVQSTGEPVSCTHPKRLVAKPTPPPRSSTGS
jgi:serine/threonine protein kinase